MQAGRKSLAFDDLNRLFRHGTLPSGDRALLDRFLDGGDEAAFEALVARHGPMVLGVCRRLLGPHDADDAFQATFLVLIRKAGRLRDADRLGPWLYGVATRVATKARARAARRRYEGPVEDVRARDDPAPEWIDVMPILDAELGRLPARLRDVLVLCLLEGVTAEEAAHRLGCPLGTVKSRLARGRESLRGRLTARGVAPAVAVAAFSSAFAPPVPAALIRTTMGMTAGVAPGVVALTRGVAMMSRSTVIAAVVLGGSALAGLGMMATMKSPAIAQAPPRAAKAEAEGKDDRYATRDHIKTIMLAFHNYNDTYGHFPPAAIYGADGQPKLSWRVALLPYLDEADLYGEFRQDEPWDSPHNKALIARMPDVYKTPNSPAPDGKTRFRGFAGKGAMFDGVKGVGVAEITDGTSNTLTIAVAEEAVPWTQPGELPFVEGQPLPPLDATEADGYLIGLADGSAHVVKKGNVAMLRGIITRSGGETINWSTQTAGPRPTATSPSTDPAGAEMAAMMGWERPRRARGERLHRPCRPWKSDSGAWRENST